MHSSNRAVKVSNMEITSKSSFLLIYFVITHLVQNLRADVCQTCLCSRTEDTTITINCNKVHVASINVIRFGLISAEYNGTLSGLDLSQNSIAEIPVDMFETSKYLKFLNLSHNNIQEIPGRVFENLNNLKVLDLSNNKIQKIQSFFLPSLQIFDLNNNGIVDLDFEFQRAYPNLYHLNLSHNKLNDSVNATLTLMPKLQHLDLSHNYFNLYDNEDFNFLKQLTTLNLSHNAIESLEKQKFPDSLIVLDVGFNLLTTLPNNLQKIQILNLEYNKIPDFENFNGDATELRFLNVSGNLLKNLSNLKFINLKAVDLSYNNFETIPVTLNNENYPALESLILDGNPLKNIEFPSNLDIKSLSIRNNSYLTKIDEQAFQKLNKKINHCLNLTLADSKLSFINEKALQGLNLCFLSLKNNRFTYLSKNFFGPELKSTKFGIDLQENPFNCNCSSQWMLDEFVPWLYYKRPELLINLRCMAPKDLEGTRMVHWYKWKEQVLCKESQLYSSRMIVQTSAVLSRSNSITLHTSNGMVIVLIAAVFILFALVVVGIVMAKRLALRRTRINRRF